MTSRIPVIPTLLVLIGVGVMIRLGFWQLDRLHQKEALLARYGAAQAMNAEVPYLPATPDIEAQLYRRAGANCVNVRAISARAGHDAHGRTGWAHVARCVLQVGGEGDVVIGWSQSPQSPVWTGGMVHGAIAPGPRLIADPPLAGLAANARPDPNDIPNNHLSYAVQWFLFAATALVIYGLALRKRLAARGGED